MPDKNVTLVIFAHIHDIIHECHILAILVAVCAVCIFLKGPILNSIIIVRNFVKILKIQSKISLRPIREVAFITWFALLKMTSRSGKKRFTPLSPAKNCFAPPLGPTKKAFAPPLATDEPN